MKLSDIFIHGKTYLLSGVSEYVLRADETENFFDQDATNIAFIIDGKGYVAHEDPDDGYRSMLGELRSFSVDNILNKFEPVEIYAEFSYAEKELVKLYDCQTKKIVLELGTDNSDDYYPCFVGSFTPENMVINRERHPEQWGSW